MIKAYWLRILLFGVVCSAIALAISLFSPKKYEGYVQLLVDQKPLSSMGVSSASGVSVSDLMEFNRSRSLETQVSQLGSLGVIKIAAEKVAAVNGQSDPSSNPASELYPPSLEREISITADQGSDIISLRVRMTSRALAEQVAREMFMAFNEQNERNGKELAGQAILALKTQAKSIDSQLKSLDEQSNKMRTAFGVADVTATVASATNNLSLHQQQRDAAEIEAAAADRQVAVLTSELASTPKTMPAGESSGPNPIYQKLVSDLIEAKSDRAKLATIYLPDRDEMKAIDERIRNIQAELKQQKPIIPSSSSSGPNPNYQNLAAKLSEAKANADSAKGRYRVAVQEVERAEKYLATLPNIQTKLAGLTRDQETLSRTYAGILDQLKVLEAARMGRMSPTKLITEAWASPDPVTPKPQLNALFGLMVGLILGALSMLATEGKRQPVRSLAQLNSLSLRPVYRLIPELREPFRGLSKVPPEPYESLLGNFLRSDSRPYRMAVVGINKDAGASTTAANLAIAASRHGASVLLVECDPKGGLPRLSGKEMPSTGAAVEVSGSIHGVYLESALSQSGGIANEVSSKESDLTIIDLEPTTRSAEYAFLAPYLDEVVLLVRAGRARSVEFLQAQQALRDAGCSRVTVVFTRSSDLSVVMDTGDFASEAEPQMGSQPRLPRNVYVPQESTEEPIAIPIAVQEVATSPAVEVVEAPSTIVEAPAEVKSPATSTEEPPKTPKRSEKPKAELPVEDFGGISIAKKPEPPKPEPEAEAPRSRRSRVDTSSITS